VNQTPGQLLREARRRHGVSQARLAVRAGTTQSAISRIERDQISPTVETMRSLLHLLGDDLELRVVEPDSGVDRSMIRERLKLTPGDRVDYGTAFTESLIRGRRAQRKAA
jgi:transcriptional regulator with XRE-family HTH domain